MTRQTFLVLFITAFLFLAVIAGVASSFIGSVSSKGQVVSKKEFFGNLTNLPNTLSQEDPIAIEIQAFVRSESPLKFDDISWVVNLSSSLNCNGVNCFLVPKTKIDNLESSNPDGSSHYVAVLNAAMFIQDTPTLVKSSFASFDAPKAVPRQIPKHELSDRPTIILNATYDDGVQITWKTHNIDESDCNLLFKIIKKSNISLNQDFC